MRLSSVTTLAMLAMAAYAAPAPAEEGTFTACLTRDGELRTGALGLEPRRPCRRGRPEVHLQTGEVTRFNFELVDDPSDVEATIGGLSETEDFFINALCNSFEQGGAAEVSLEIIDGESLAGAVVISSEERTQPDQSVSSVTEFAELQRFLTSDADLLWYEADFMPRDLPPEQPDYIVSLKLFGFGLPDNRCQFSGEVRMIELPELEVVE